MFVEKLGLRAPELFWYFQGNFVGDGLRIRMTPYFQVVCPAGNLFERTVSAAFLTSDAYWDRNLLAHKWDSWQVFSLRMLTISMLATLVFGGEAAASGLAADNPIAALQSDLPLDKPMHDPDIELARGQVLVWACLPHLGYDFLEKAEIGIVAKLYQEAFLSEETKQSFIRRVGSHLDQLAADLRKGGSYSIN